MCNTDDTRSAVIVQESTPVILILHFVVFKTLLTTSIRFNFSPTRNYCQWTQGCTVRIAIKKGT